MPNRLHPAKWGPRDRSFDALVRDLVDQRGYGHAREYVGVTTEERAEQVRRGIRNAGRALGHSIKAFWKPCPGCQDGGADCRFHIEFTAYEPGAARAYKARQQQNAQGNNEPA